MLKHLIRETLIFLHLDITKNLKYDRLTKRILSSVLKPDSNCIDIGCHKGEILDLLLKYAPKGVHFGFEPLPHLFNDLKLRYANRATIYPFALSDKKGSSSFQWVKNAPAYSGILQRSYDTSNPEIEEIHVELNRLDELIPANIGISLIKIDVEGGEFGVLRGATELLKRDHPVIIFECGMGASDKYGTTPGDLYQFMAENFGYTIFTLEQFLNRKQPLSEAAFREYFYNNKEYYFVAAVA